jgi:hypothetical protein
MTFDELCSHQKIYEWLHAHGYYLVLSECQSSDMLKIGFLTSVRPFTWREDLRDMIKNSLEWRENPFQFRLFFGSISSNKKGVMAPVLMVEVERDNVSSGMDYFCNMFDSENPLSPCGIPYLFFSLYQNSLSDSERINIIQDTNHHVGHYQLLRLYGLTNVDTALRKLLLNIKAHHSSSNMFIQVEKESEPESILCAFESSQYEEVMTNVANISTYIRQCIMEEDYTKFFANQDYSLVIPQRLISTKKGAIKPQVIPLDIHEHSSGALNKLIKVTKRVSPSSSVSSHSVPSSTTISTESISKNSSYLRAAQHQINHLSSDA